MAERLPHLGRLRDRSRAESGFTLIEALVVLVVMAVLLALAIPMFPGLRDQQRNRAMLAAAEQVTRGLTAMNGDKPKGLAGDPLASGSKTITAENQRQELKSPSGNAYFRSWPESPFDEPITVDIGNRSATPGHIFWERVLSGAGSSAFRVTAYGEVDGDPILIYRRTLQADTANDCGYGDVGRCPGT